MYTEFYGLREKPFRLVPDPRFLFLSDCHREALAHLHYGIEQGEGFIQVVGQVGTGKTTLCRTLLERIGSSAEIAYIFNPSRTELDLLASINREFGLPTAARSRSELADELNRFLLAKKAVGRQVLLIIDEAQNLDPDVLEEIRLLSNLETGQEKLLQIVLIGQPELEDNLSRSDLRQLRQRITVRWDLRPFDRDEVAAYVSHRLKIAGLDRGDLFDRAALRRLYRASGGVPRMVNAIADRALLAGYSEGATRIDARLVRGAARELPGAESAGLEHWLGLGRLASSALILCGVLLGLVVTAWMPGVASSSDAEIPSVEVGRNAAAGSALEVAPVSSGPPAGSAETPAGQAGVQSPSPHGGLLETTTKASAAVALRSVLGLWGYPSPPYRELDPNLFASAVRDVSSLRVFATRATLSKLAGIGLPAILELEPAPDQRRYVALLGLSGQNAIAIGLRDGEIELDEGMLRRLWTGRTFYVWDNFERLPALGPGMRGSAVRWLQSRLTELGYLEQGVASGEFDGFTLEAVRTFQSEHVIPDSGEVGPATMIALYQVLGYGGPRLTAGGGRS